MYTEKDDLKDTINFNRKATINNFAVRLDCAREDIEKSYKDDGYHCSDGYTDWKMTDIEGMSEVIEKLKQVEKTLKECKKQIRLIERRTTKYYER